MRLVKIENIVFVICILFLSVVMYTEYTIKRDMYKDEKIYDLKLQYKDKILFNDKIIDALLDELFEDKVMKQILAESNAGKNKQKNREKLYLSYKKKFEDFKKRGIGQFQFHLANGDSFIRFHKPEKYGDSLLFRNSIRKVIKTHEKEIGFEIGRYFEGFRYIYPIFLEGKYIGSVEASIETSEMLKQMKNMLDSNYNVVLKSTELAKSVLKKKINSNYHKFCGHDDYLMANPTHIDNIDLKSILKGVDRKLKTSIDKKDAFAEFAKDKGHILHTIVFIPIVDVNEKNVGYFFSIREDNTIQKIELLQIFKFIISLILFSIILYFYKQSKAKTKTIEQLNKAIDLTTLVSKTDLKGRITYVNDAFEKLSGYTKDELMGKPHSIVREPSMPKSAFKDMWTTIQNKKMWQGTITNRKKDGSTYTVSANIMPILNVNGKIKEYIAIRHDITELEKYKEILKEQLDDRSKSLEENINYTKQYEEAINGSTAVLKTDTNNIIEYANEQFCKLSGYRKDELIGRNCRELRHENHIRMGDCDKLIERLKNKEVVSIVFTNVAKDKSLYFLDTLVYPIINLDGKVTEHLHLMHDISEIINLHQELEDTQKEIIYKMGEIGETRSKETGNHVKRVAEYSQLLASLYGLSEKDSEVLRLASPMHDIGKVGIPDSVLKKPGKLDAEEWEIMQTHAELGYEMLKHSTRPILQAASIVAGQHHEKFDGSGYPNGLKADDIHIYGRITAIADVFDALGSNRVYKQAWELDKILNLFEEEKGKHFDPKLVEIFFENLDSFLEIRDKFKD
ncbi:PAS domain S-box protein [Sulfurimonas sp.]|uniref:PAS domain S-box protein n=1 Tax=Sulfurimonas sp. TaxID=2022749 RepID=UPI003561B6D2